MLGRKRYAPPRTVTKRGISTAFWRSPASFGTENDAVGWPPKRGQRGPSRGSVSSGNPSKFAFIIHALWTNSNWRAMLAFRQRKKSPLGFSPAGAGERASAGEMICPYSRPRRSRRWKRVETDGVLAQRLLRKANHAQELLDRARGAGGHIGCAWVGAADVRAQGTGKSHLVRGVVEVVQRRVAQFDAVDCLGLKRDDGLARDVTTDHGARQAFQLGGISL